jgi:DNA polymerase-3 subunit alpha
VTKRNEAVGQFDLFSVDDPGADDAEALDPVAVPPIPLGEWDKTALLAAEREMLGLYVSDHPLLGLEHVLAAAADCTVARLTSDDERPDGQIVTVAGLISGLQRKVTKQGSPWAIASLEDLDGVIDVMVFPQTYQLVATQLVEDAIVVVKGRVDRREDQPKLVAMELTLPDLSDGPRGPVVISLPVARCVPPVVDRLKEVLATHPGVTEVHLQLVQQGGRTTVMRLDERLRVTPGPALYGDLKALLGPGSVS